MPTLSKQAAKYSVGLAGEHYVTAELLRRGLTAALAMGNAKKMDVLVLNRETMTVVIVEVKSSTKKEWIVGNVIPAASAQPWVFVHLPESPAGAAPQYFIVTAEVIHGILAPEDAAYRESYFKRHSKHFAGKGVCKLKMKDIVNYENNWSIITDIVKSALC